ncbi:hypothetical protein ASPWEDRAFT_46078 [Aspergillus wentii DTO 134E9]|uniref:Uncharacterized protein n=1 Tax=Aspergillus wentii DTO 134E9 TaxID=1073089 RepID=A0A1L9R6D8_ASPWE|nr:uncharacterized protein ASPWEDRAFT_46078 [Aspergillus wentii DTO 134E9]OJJ30476.1 hypothetical protein ASPWEDRAFT_46078 [Aspergillus wentii DTO 134E9]
MTYTTSGVKMAKNAQSHDRRFHLSRVLHTTADVPRSQVTPDHATPRLRFYQLHRNIQVVDTNMSL